jgi:hypothetical protein
MSRPLASFAVLAALAMFASPAFADRAVPDPPPGVTAPLVMKYEKGAKTHTLVIPKKFLEGVKVGQLQQDEAGQAEVSFAGDNGRTILAGCALSMAVGSVVFLRRRHVSAAVVLVAGACTLGAGSLGWADVPVDPPAPAKMNVVIEVVEKGDAVTFIVPTRR